METEPTRKKEFSLNPRAWSRNTRQNFKLGMYFIAPWTIGFLLFTVYPMGASLVYSFSEYHIRQPLTYIGLTNFINLFQDKNFYTALLNTMYMVAVGVPISLLLSFGCALLLNIKVKGQSIYRVIYFLPSIVPTIASTLLWLWILNPSSGLMNRMLSLVGINGPNWLQNPYWSKPALILLLLWGMGSTIVIYLSGLQDVPVSLIEAAELDGASWWQRLINITIPMVSPITLFNLITGVIAMFQYFAQAYVVGVSAGNSSSALGSPLGSTLFYSVYLYQTGFLYLKMGYASAMAWILFFIILICTMLLFKISNRYTYYSG